MSTERHPAAARVVLGVILTIVSAIGYSFSLVLARVSYDHGTNALTIMVIRFVLLLALMLVWNRVRRQPVRVRGRKLWLCYLAGVTYFIGIGAYLGSVGFIPVSLAVLAFYTYPFLTALLVSLLRRRWPTAAQALLLVSAFVGLGLALGVHFQVMAPIGLLLAVTAAFGVAVNMIISSVALRELDLSVFTQHMAMAALVCSLIAIIVADAFALPGNDPRGWLVLGLSLLAFLVAFVALYAGLRLIGAERLSMVMNLEPIATILIALQLLDESMTTQQVLGGTIVLVAVVIAQFTGRRSQ